MTPDDTATDTAPLLWSVKQAAQELGISTYSCKELIESGAIPYTKIGARLFVPRDAVHRYVADLSRRSA